LGATLWPVQWFRGKRTLPPPLKYWEVIADKLYAPGWSWGYGSAVTKDRWRWIVDAHREGRRYFVHSDELLSAFLELEQTLL